MVNLREGFSDLRAEPRGSLWPGVRVQSVRSVQGAFAGASGLLEKARWNLREGDGASLIGSVATNCRG